MGLPLVANGRFWAGMNRCTLITAIKGEGLVIRKLRPIEQKSERPKFLLRERED